MTNKVYAELAGLIVARLNYAKSGNTEWYINHEDKAESIVNEYLPSGSGIDAGVKINFDKSTKDKLVFDSSLHIMDENGYYAGWIDFVAIVTPSLQYGFSLTIKGKFSKFPWIKDELYDTFQYALDKEVTL